MNVWTPISASGLRATSRGFTLIELMVSLGIIAVLLAILLPALQSMRSEGIALKCTTRLASIGAMYQLSASEHQGMLPTFVYPLDSHGLPDPLFVPEWGDGGDGWLILPISEIWFWAYQMRPYASDDPDIELLQTVERLSCPVVHGEWVSGLSPLEHSGAVRDPMHSPQRSYVHSAALFTQASAWSDPSAPPNINMIHAPVRLADVAFPSMKANLVEASSHHDRHRIKLESAVSEFFNVLAIDGHVKRRRASESRIPMGFTGAPTGYEEPPITSDQWIKDGLRFISTQDGHLGRDW